jgi:hypothetical protein
VSWDNSGEGEWPSFENEEKYGNKLVGKGAVGDDGK